MLIKNPTVQRALLRALADEHSARILAATAYRPRSVLDLIREENIPPTTAYRRVHELEEDLRKVVRAIDLARKTRAVGAQNLVVSVALLAVLIPFAALGWLGIAGAVAAHEGSEILVVLSGVRMLRA